MRGICVEDIMAPDVAAGPDVGLEHPTELVKVEGAEMMEDLGAEGVSGGREDGAGGEDVVVVFGEDVLFVGGGEGRGDKDVEGLEEGGVVGDEGDEGTVVEAVLVDASK